MSSATTSQASLRRSVALVWRSLRSMRTALVLLLLLALGAVAGSLVPQVGVADARIVATFRDHPLRARLYDQLGLFDVYGSWWFTMIYTLLLVSLVACAVPRTRAFLRSLQTRPAPARELDAMRHYAEVRLGAEPDRAIRRARAVLRRRLFRVSGPYGTPALAADKGLGREGGSLMFHLAFLVLLVGIVWGRGTGFSGQGVIAEGVKFYQFGYGWAPVLRVEQDGVIIFDGPVVCQQDTGPEDLSQLQIPWNCVAKLPSLEPQVGIRL